MGNSVINKSTTTLKHVDQDGDPEIVEFSRDFTGDGQKDSIVVVNRNDDVTETDSPRSVLDYRDGLLIYDAGADGVAELIISFNYSGGEYPWTAKIYDSRTGSLEYNFTSESYSGPRIQNRSATVTMSSKNPWIQDSYVSYRLHLECTPEVRCSHDAGKYNPNGVTIRIVDQDQNGIPEYEVRQIDTGHGPAATLHRTELMVNRGSERVLSPDDGILWPYVGTARNYSYVGSGKPPLRIDWNNGTVSAVGEFVSSRGDEDNYFIYSWRRITRDGINPQSWEFPFTFHDLAADDDGTPELSVRIAAHQQGSNRPLGLYPANLPFDYAQTRYSWDQTNDGRWNYKLGVVGANGYTDATTVGPYRLRMPQYSAVPEWVRSQRWRSVSFVATARGSKSSEGIYTGDFSQTERRQALGFESYTPPLLGAPGPGYRLEVNGRYDSQPRLYFSPIDNSLHLYDFRYGFWNRSDAPNVSYRNVDSDPYVDSWTEHGERERRLIAEDNHLVYATDETLTVKRTPVEHTAFTTQPPATTDEWEQLRDRIPDQPNATFDIERTFHRYEGETITVTDATFTEYEPTENGFRVFASLSSESQVTGNTSLELPDTNTAVFVFHENNGTINVQPATPPSLSIGNVSSRQGSITPLEQNTIEVGVRNDGWQTAENVTVLITDDDGRITSRRVPVIGQRTTTVKLNWWPQSNTEATVEIRTGGETVATRPLVAPSNQLTRPSVLARYAVANQSVPLAVGLGFVVSLGLLLTLRRILT